MATPYATVHAVYGSATHTDRQQRQVMENLTRIFPESTPFLTFTNKTAAITDGRANKLEWQYLSEFPRYVTVNGAVAADGTTIVVDSATHVQEGQILQDTVTGEQILILSKTGNTLTVATRGSQGGGTPAILADNKNLLLLGTSIEEGSTAKSPIGIVPGKDYNYFQQFEHVHGITDRSQALLMYGPSQGSIDEQEALLEYKKKIERQMLFGYRKEISPGSSGATTHPRWHMGGLRDYIETGGNVFDAGGAFTYKELCTYMRETVREGASSTKYGFASMAVMDIMSNWALATNQAEAAKVSEYGVDITRYKGVGWTLNLVRNDQFETDDVYQTWLMIVDPKFVKRHVMRGANLQDTVNKNITGPKQDGDHTSRHQITGTHTLQVSVPNSMAIIKNITS